MKQEHIPEDFMLTAVFRYSAFYDLLADAAFQHRHAKQSEDKYAMSSFARASVLASALSVECAANCLLASLDISKSLSSELERLTPMAKVETYFRLRAVEGFDRGCSEVQRIAELIKARNEHVHPKESVIPAKVNMPQVGGENWLLPFNLDGEHWDQLRIPKRSLFWSDSSSLAALAAVASFYTYIFCTLLNATEDELHGMLPSRLEIGNTHVLTVFDEVRSELKSIADHGIDFSFFKLFTSTSANTKQAI